MPWMAAIIAANAVQAVQTMNAARGGRSTRYPLTPPRKVTWWDGFAPIAIPTFYASALVAAVSGAIWCATHLI